ncbi:MAG: hypothetical protein JXA03_12510 [Bacteroidales bacterium]|nr:hypothetical protein [Bacteroidales bacterium]
MKKITVFFSVILITLSGAAQLPDRPAKAHYMKYNGGYYRDVILKSLNDTATGQSAKERLRADMNGFHFPTDTALYTRVWHNPPVSQGRTGTCWTFAAISMLESEIFRISGKKTRLSEMYVVYFEYIERIKAIAKKSGEVYFAEGSESNAVTKIIREYGIIPLEAFPGKPVGQEFHDHKLLFERLETYKKWVEFCKSATEAKSLGGFEEILTDFLGAVPDTFQYEGREYTPMSFSREALPFSPMDYFSFMSTKSAPYNQRGELVEADNWWHNSDYYNVALEDFVTVAVNAISNGYSFTVCGDVSEPGFDALSEAAVIPAFDIPSEYINEDSREHRLYNQSTTDDHCMHVVGFYRNDDGYWFLLKDSGAGAFDGPNKGYRFMHEDYLRLKMMNILVHKEAARPVLDKIIK